MYTGKGKSSLESATSDLRVDQVGSGTQPIPEWCLITWYSMHLFTMYHRHVYHAYHADQERGLVF